MNTFKKLSCAGIAAAGLVLAGCGGGDAEAEGEPTAEAPVQTPEQAVATAPPVVKEQWTAYDQAVQKQDYQRAADALLKVEFSQAPLTEQQAFNQVNRMRELSREIANAAASGDPRAMQAAELLRRAQQMRMGMSGQR